MVEFTVGKEFPLADCRGKEGFFFDYDEGGTATLTVAFPHMKPLELPLHIFAVESTTNIIQGIRTVGMGTRWTNELSRMVEEQKKMPFDYAEYYGTVKMCQQRWSSKELMRMSTVTYKLGASEKENPFEVIRGGKNG